MGQNASPRRPARRPWPRARRLARLAQGLLLSGLGLLSGCRQLSCEDVPAICQPPVGDFGIEVSPRRLSREGGTLTVRRLDGEFDAAQALAVRLSLRLSGNVVRYLSESQITRTDRSQFSIAIKPEDLVDFPAGSAQLTVQNGSKTAYSAVYLFNTLSFDNAVSGNSGESRGVNVNDVALPWLHLGPQRRVYTLERRLTGLSSYRRAIHYQQDNLGGLTTDSSLISADIISLYDVSATDGALLTLLGDRQVGFNISGTNKYFLACPGKTCTSSLSSMRSIAGLAALVNDQGSFFATAEGSAIRVYRLDDNNRVVDTQISATSAPVRFLLTYEPGQSLLAAHTDGSASVLVLDAAAGTLTRDTAASARMTEQIGKLADRKPPAALAVGDLDGDRRPDLALVKQSDLQVLVLAVDQPDGDYLIVTPPMMNFGEVISALDIGDLDGDKRLDLGVGSNFTLPDPGNGTIGRVRAFLNSSRF